MDAVRAGSTSSTSASSTPAAAFSVRASRHLRAAAHGASGQAPHGCTGHASCASASLLDAAQTACEAHRGSSGPQHASKLMNLQAQGRARGQAAA